MDTNDERRGNGEGGTVRCRLPADSPRKVGTARCRLVALPASSSHFLENIAKEIAKKIDFASLTRILAYA